MVASQPKVLLFLPLLLCACDTAPTAPRDPTAPIVPAAHTNSTAPTTFVLHTRHQFRFEASRSQSISGLLPRELGRQSLLIAARDELGMRTRDASLREVNAKQQIKVVAGGALPSAGVLGQNADAIELLLTVDAAIDGKCMLRISALREAKFHEIWSQELKFRAGGRETYTTLAPQFEALSRGEFVDVLKQLGATQRQVDAAPSLGADAETEKHDDDIGELLQNVDLFSQFLAVRRLHRENRAAGDSPERLGQLAIGYANLGLLTECYWGATSRVFRARAMTYAERLKAKYAEDALSSWHWAYVYGVSGAHRPALQEAKRLNSESETSDPKTSLPGWTSLIEPYCHYDIEALAVIADSDSPTRKWARYLRYWSLFNAGEKRLMTTEAQQLIADCHEAFNLYCLLSTEGQLGLMHRASQWSLQAMVGHCRQTIGGNPELPESVVAAATANPTRSAPLEAWGATMAALREVDDAEAMSWGLLGTLMEETAVMVAALQLKVAQQASQEHSLQPYVDMFRPAIKHHPNVGFFDSAPHWRQGDMQALRNAGRELRFLDPTLWQRSHLHYLWSVRNTSGEQIGKNAYYCANRDFVVPQVVLAMRFQQNPDDFQRNGPSVSSSCVRAKNRRSTVLAIG